MTSVWPSKLPPVEGDRRGRFFAFDFDFFDIDRFRVVFAFLGVFFALLDRFFAFFAGALFHEVEAV